MDNLELEKYWNEKLPTQPIIYAGRSITNAATKQTISLNIDVRNLITPYDSFLQDIIAQNNLKADTNDETMMRIQRYVCSHLRYVGDEQNVGLVEFWQFPFETLATGIGDCEDMAILICSLGINAGVPEFRLRVVAGYVQESPIAPKGGHGYCAYLREGGYSEFEKNQWIILDGCYFPDPEISIIDKPILKNNEKYKDIWFSFNSRFSWGKASLDTTSKRLKEIK